MLILIPVVLLAAIVIWIVARRVFWARPGGTDLLNTLFLMLLAVICASVVMGLLGVIYG